MRNRFTLRKALLALPAAAVMTLAGGTLAHAESETDRLREALRTLTTQVRALEDQGVAMKAQLAETTRARDALKADVAKAREIAKKAQADYRTAVTEFNERLEERNQTLEKWKEAYAEAATVARTKDAERAKFESESIAYKASTKTCTLKNKELVKVGRELLAHYEGVTFGDQVLAREPLVGFRRVEIQTFLQDYGDKVLNQKVDP
jgi:DNA repair exonuclease SbcCD ATPase subunit